jgi:hypothetical protein
MPEALVIFAIFPATLGAAYFAQRGLLTLLFRAMMRNEPQH